MTSCSSQLISSLHSLLCSTPPPTPVKKAWLGNEEGGGEASVTVSCCRNDLTSEGGAISSGENFIGRRGVVCDRNGDTTPCTRNDDDVRILGNWETTLGSYCDNILFVCICWFF